MSTERWQRLERIFAEARRLPVDERAEFLNRATDADDTLRRDALGLLAADAVTDDFLARPALDRLAENVASEGWGLRSGDRLGAYTVLRKLGVGGGGEVWRARDERLDRDVAIKVLLPHFTSDADHLRRFANEARAASALNHPNILTVHDVGEHDGSPFLVTECLEGQSLRDRIATGPVSADQAVAIALGIAQGLAAAHSSGIVHRDLKPENVFLRSDGGLKILDFGLAKLRSTLDGTRDARNPTLSGVIMGTAAYMAPEQVRGEAVDARADLFAMGVILYEMLAGRHPFNRASTFETLHAMLTIEPPELSTANPQVSGPFARIVTRLLQKAPEARFQSAIDLIWTLEQLAPGLSDDRDQRGAKASGRRLRQAIVAAVLVSILGAAAFLAGRARPADAPALDPTRVAVALFENRTGDPSLDAVGRMTSEALVQGLRETGAADVVPAPVAADEASVLGRRHGAGMIVSGAYYLEGDSVRFQPSILNATQGKLIFAMDAFRGTRQAPDAAIEAMRQRVMGAVVVHLNPDWFFPHARPPTYGAYREMIAGFEMFGKDYALAERHFKRACELDPYYAWPALHLAAVYLNQGRFEEGQAALNEMLAIRDQYSPFERLFLDWLQAAAANRPLEQLRVLRQAEELEPTNLVMKHNIGRTLTYINQPRAAVEILSRTDFSRGDKYGFSHWFNADLATAHHILGDFEAELAVAKRTREKTPGEISVRVVETRALAALGFFDELERSIGEGLTLPPDDSGNGGLLLGEVASELRAHGRREAASAAARRAVAWWRERMVGESTPEARRALAQALYQAEEWDSADALFAELVKSNPEDVQAMGYGGAIAARKGDRAAALRRSEDLRGIEGPHLFGRHTLWRARIAALLGERDQAVDLLRDALGQGVVYDLWVHRDMDLEPLRGDPSFEELVRPKG